MIGAGNPCKQDQDERRDDLRAVEHFDGVVRPQSGTGHQPLLHYRDLLQQGFNAFVMLCPTYWFGTVYTVKRSR